MQLKKFSPSNPFFFLINRTLSSILDQTTKLLSAEGMILRSEAFQYLKPGTTMELQHSKSRTVEKNMHKEYAFSFKSFPKALLPDLTAQYQLVPSPSKSYPKTRHYRVDSITTKMIKLGERVDIFAQGIREHVRLGPKLSEMVKGKLSLGARILQVGGVEKVFKQKFKIERDDEKLLKASQCYLSTTAGPVAGLLFISNNRVAFCSERPIKLSSPSRKLLKVHYKVMIPLRRIKRTIESKNAEKPMQKYAQVVTEDNFEFWFMGFLNHQRTLKYLQQAIHQCQMRLQAKDLDVIPSFS